LLNIRNKNLFNKIQQNAKKNKKKNKNSLDNNFFNGGLGYGGVHLGTADAGFLEEIKWKT